MRLTAAVRLTSKRLAHIVGRHGRPPHMDGKGGIANPFHAEYRRPSARVPNRGTGNAPGERLDDVCVKLRASWVSASTSRPRLLFKPFKRQTEVCKCPTHANGLTETTGGGRPLGSGRQLPPQLAVGRRPLGGGGGGVREGEGGGV